MAITEEQKNIIRRRLLPGDEEKDLETINVLDLNGLGIKELPKSIGKLRNLGYLNLARNQLKSLPEEIENLRNLGYLSLAHNQLKSLPGSIEGLVYLMHLDLTNNQLKSLPGSIEGLVSLMHLDLTNNPLTDIRSRLYIGQDLVILQENLALPPKPSTTKAQASGCQAEGEHDRGQ